MINWRRKYLKNMPMPKCSVTVHVFVICTYLILFVSWDQIYKLWKNSKSKYGTEDHQNKIAFFFVRLWYEGYWPLKARWKIIAFWIEIKNLILSLLSLYLFALVLLVLLCFIANKRDLLVRLFSMLQLYAH